MIWVYDKTPFSHSSFLLRLAQQGSESASKIIVDVFLCSAKGFQHHRMTNGAMNVEIGNPAYKIYEGDPDDDAGELLDSDFALDPDKVTKLKKAVSLENIWKCLVVANRADISIFMSFF